MCVYVCVCVFACVCDGYGYGDDDFSYIVPPLDGDKRQQ